MSISDQLDKMKDIQKLLLKYVESETDNEENYQNLFNLLEDLNISQSKEKIESMLILINNVSNYHFRFSNFNLKIANVVRYLLKGKQTLSNDELFFIFKDNKKLLLNLFEENHIVMNESIARSILEYPNQDAYYPYYFYPQIKPFISDKIAQQIYSEINIPKDDNFLKNFRKNQNIGENENYVCELIRKDQINDFTSYCRQVETNLYSEIKPSIFETNSFLLSHKPLLIDYAAFYGAINIFRFIFTYMNNDPKYKQNIWLYLAHCPNEDIMKILNENNIKIPSSSYNFNPFNEKVDPYDIVLEESIKCHHIDFANFIFQNYINEKIMSYNTENNFERNVYAYAFKYRNYVFFPSDMNYKFLFYYACKYNYYEVVEFMLKCKSINLNIPIILKKINY